MSTIEAPDGRVEPVATGDVDYRTQYEPNGTGSPSVTVVSALSEALDADVTVVEPLYHTIDPDALDSLFVHPDGPTGTELTFVHEGCSVTVRGDGDVLVTVLDT